MEVVCSAPFLCFFIFVGVIVYVFITGSERESERGGLTECQVL
jgi:hypothetical protein